jgi:hypothetical protein
MTEFELWLHMRHDHRWGTCIESMTAPGMRQLHAADHRGDIDHYHVAVQVETVEQPDRIVKVEMLDGDGQVES